MPIYDEMWNQDEYLTRAKINLQTLPANHMKKLSNLKFNFVEYKSNQLLACHLYDRMLLHCHNQYGIFEEFKSRPECLEAFNFFHTCIKLNAGYGIQKKYFREEFAGDIYSRAVPHFGELGIN